MPDHPETFANDVVYGAGPLAIELRGSDTPEHRRWVYYQASKFENPLGLFWLGDRICGRRSRFAQLGATASTQL